MIGYGYDSEEPAHLGDASTLREPLVRAAAMQVGMIIFAFSRLDMHLALGLGWAVEEGAPAAERAQSQGLGFHDKLALLQSIVHGMAVAERQQAFQGWIDQCRAVDVLRNEFVYGRWLPDVRTGKVVNLTDEADGSTGEVAYTIPELEAVVAQIDSLRADLLALRRPLPAMP